MSQFRVEKRRAEAQLTLSGDAVVRGWFFLAESAARHAGPERVADLLNTEAGFFPFVPAGGTTDDTVLVNRAHVISVKLLEPTHEPQADPGYDVATERHVVMRLSNGSSLAGAVRVYRPQGRDRLSDYARLPEVFRYVESLEGVFVVNSAHIVDLRETSA
jgi:hypothetical protein